MKITVVTGMREFFLPFRIHSDVLVEGLRIDGAAAPPRLPRAAWYSPSAGDAYHDFIFDPADDTVELFARYVLETAAGTESLLVMLPFDSLLGESSHPPEDTLRFTSALRNLAPPDIQFSLRPLTWTGAAADLLRDMGHAAFGPPTRSGHPKPSPLGPSLPPALEEAFARNYTYWAAYLGAALHLHGKTEDLRTPARRTAKAFAQAGLKIGPQLTRDEVVRRVAEVFPVLFA